MALNYTQDNLLFSISTPLGKDKLLLNGFHGEEQVSGLFQFTLEMVSEDKALDFDEIVGKDATITIECSNGSKRYISGMVSRFVQAGITAEFSTYYAELRPWAWMLTMTTDSRIFQNKSVPDIIEAVFTDLGFSDYRNALKGTYTAREYCVQYQESAFSFISRLMEDEGIFYFFEHTDGKHTLVLGDDADANSPCENLSSAQYRNTRSGDTSMEDDLILECQMEQQITAGTYAVHDYNFETPDTNLLASVSGNNGKMKQFEYPAGFDNKDLGEQKAKVRIESCEAKARVLEGVSTCRAFVTGHTFKMIEHPRTDLNSTYVLKWISHKYSREGYSNTFKALPSDVPYRAPMATPKALIHGAQTAIVVGKEGEEIWTDKYGRIKVQFHWDREGKEDENSSCWIRVDQGWAGKKWGGLFLPRIGQEVLVSFLEGDPDRPIITGAVYNANQTMPYDLPTDQTKSTIKTNSSKGGSGFNEIRFEDKKDAEELFIQAQKDMKIDILNDQTSTITKNRTTTIQEENDTLTVEKGDRIINVNTGKETHEVKGTRTLTITGNETHTNKADISSDISGNETHEVKGTRALTITGKEAHTNKAAFEQDVSGNFTLSISGNLTIEATGSVSIKSGTAFTNKAGTSLTNEAGTSLTNKGGASQTVESSGILTLKGSLVKIN